MAIDDNTSYELTGYQVKDLAGRIRRKAEASEVPTSISDLGQVTSSDIDWSTITKNSYVARTASSNQTPGTSWSSITGLGPFSYTPTTNRIAIYLSVDYHANATQSNIIIIGYRIDGGNDIEIALNDWFPGNCAKNVSGITFARVTPGVTITIEPRVRGASNFTMRQYSERKISVWDV